MNTQFSKTKAVHPHSRTDVSGRLNPWFARGQVGGDELRLWLHQYFEFVVDDARRDDLVEAVMQQCDDPEVSAQPDLRLRKAIACAIELGSQTDRYVVTPRCGSVTMTPTACPAVARPLRWLGLR